MSQAVRRFRTTAVIPAYEAADSIERAIRSALTQTHPPIEVLVVDDGSKDGTPEVVRAIDNLSVQLIQLSSNRGANYARNVGIDRASGDFVAFLDADDAWLPHKLACQLSALATEPDYVGAVGGMRTVEPGRTLLVHPTRRRWDHKSVFRQEVGPWSASGLVARTAVARSVRFDERLPAAQDWDFILRLAEVGPIVSLPITLFEYRRHSAGVSSRQNVLEAHELLTAKYAQRLEEDPVARTQLLLRMTRSLAVLGYPRSLVRDVTKRALVGRSDWRSLVWRIAAILGRRATAFALAAIPFEHKPGLTTRVEGTRP